MSNGINVLTEGDTVIESESGNRILIDLGRITATFYHKHKTWCAERGLVCYTEEQCAQWARLAVDDVLNTFMKWAPSGTTSAHDYLESQVDWYYGSNMYDLRALALDDLLFTHIKQPILNNIGFTWHVWYVRDFAGDLLLEEGMDYRVTEYYRLTKQPLPEDE